MVRGRNPSAAAQSERARGPAARSAARGQGLAIGVNEWRAERVELGSRHRGGPGERHRGGPGTRCRGGSGGANGRRGGGEGAANGFVWLEKRWLRARIWRAQCVFFPGFLGCRDAGGRAIPGISAQLRRGRDWAWSGLDVPFASWLFIPAQRRARRRPGRAESARSWGELDGRARREVGAQRAERMKPDGGCGQQ